MVREWLTLKGIPRKIYGSQVMTILLENRWYLWAKKEHCSYFLRGATRKSVIPVVFKPVMEKLQ